MNTSSDLAPACHPVPSLVCAAFAFTTVYALAAPPHPCGFVTLCSHLLRPLPGKLLLVRLLDWRQMPRKIPYLPN